MLCFFFFNFHCLFSVVKSPSRFFSSILASQNLTFEKADLRFLALFLCQKDPQAYDTFDLIFYKWGFCEVNPVIMKANYLALFETTLQIVLCIDKCFADESVSLTGYGRNRLLYF